VRGVEGSAVRLEAHIISSLQALNLLRLLKANYPHPYFRNLDRKRRCATLISRALVCPMPPRAISAASAL
jgi:hypothetical protein